MNLPITYQVDSTEKVVVIISDLEKAQRFRTGRTLDEVNSWSQQNTVETLTMTSTLRLRHLGKCCAPFNRSLILATWFIHVATADITTLINHAVRHAGCPRARAGLTNLNTIFHLNNLALPQGRPTPDTAHWREALLVLLFLSLWAQRLSAACQSRQTQSCVLPGRSRPTLNHGQ